MSELFEHFDPQGSTPAPPQTATPMTTEQRSVIRALFAELALSQAREQFELIDVLIGMKLRSVEDLDARNAARLIPRLKKRVETRKKTPSGDAWRDREEDTWIDHL